MQNTVQTGVGLSGVCAAGTESVLLAEDDETLRSALQFLLEQSGYTVIPAGDGEEVLQLLEEAVDPVDLMLLDMVMPKLSGRHVYEQIQRRYPDLRVVFTSGYGLDSDLTQFIEDQGLPFVQKPCSFGELLGKVREVLDSTGGRTSA